MYVAAKFEEAARAREAMAKLKEAGIEITHDWTGEDAEKMAGPEGEKYKTECATSDYKGVKRANAVLVINHDRLFGGAAEMGMALAWGKKVFVVDSKTRYNIFFSLPSNMITMCDSLDDGINKIKEIAARERS